MISIVAVATEYVFDDQEELKSPRYFYTDYVQLLKDAEIDKKIMWSINQKLLLMVALEFRRLLMQI